MSTVKTRDAILAAIIVVGFIIFQVGGEWTSGAGAFMAILGLAIVVGAIATMVYDNVAKKRLDEEPTVVEQPALSRFLFHDTRSAPLWLAIRLYLGFSWLEAGWHKVTDPKWTETGVALQGYWKNAVAINPQTQKGPITYDWFRHFLQFMLENNWHTWFGKVIAYGELLVGIGIIVGGLVGIAAFFGALMNMSFMLAGTASTNPILLILSIFLMLGWQVAGYWGFDRFILPMIGAPWRPGAIFHRHTDRPTPVTS